MLFLAIQCDGVAMVIVYTTIFGGSDSLKPAPTGADRCVCFVDRLAGYPDANGWTLIQRTLSSDPRRYAWHLRCVPHLLFDDYDRVVWIDASLTLTNLPRLLADAGSHAIAAQDHHRRSSPYQEARELIYCGQSSRADIDRQLRAYQAVRFPAEQLHTSSFLVRDNSDQVARFNETWDAQIQMYPGDNTQVSLDYSAWVHGLTIHSLAGTRHVNPYATHDKIDHRQRRKPYRPEHVAVR